jgi:hypothetical protein
MESDNETTEASAGSRPLQDPCWVNGLIGAGTPRDARRQAAVSRLPGNFGLWLQLQTDIVAEERVTAEDVCGRAAKSAIQIAGSQFSCRGTNERRKVMRHG